MPINVTEEMRQKVIGLITDNPIIKRTHLIEISGQKEWYIAGTLSELMNDKIIFKQVKDGRAHYCMMDYAIANSVPSRIVKGKEGKPYVQPNAKDVSLLSSQLMFNSLFQVAQ